MKFLKVFAILLFLTVATSAFAQGVEKINAQGLRDIINANKGRILIVNFWATWCAPCIKEFPGLVAVRKDFSENDLHIVAISVDYSAKPVELFMQKNKVNIPVFLDNGDISKMLAVQSIPRTMVFSRSGEKVLDHLGFISEESFRHMVERLLKMP